MTEKNIHDISARNATPNYKSELEELAEYRRLRKKFRAKFTMHDTRPLAVTGLEAAMEHTVHASALLQIVQFYAWQQRDMNADERHSDIVCTAMSGIETLMALTEYELKMDVD